MKSIKEKANEYARDYSFSSLPQIAPNIHFEAGANYVVECIEELIPNDEVLQNNVRCKSAIFRIQAIIGQLKEK